MIKMEFLEYESDRHPRTGLPLVGILMWYALPGGGIAKRVSIEAWAAARKISVIFRKWRMIE